jgi:hypothetical protein
MVYFAGMTLSCVRRMSRVLVATAFVTDAGV